MSLTMARLSPMRAFRSDDLPALVAPTMATGMPSLMARPEAKESASRLTSPWISTARRRRLWREANSTSSSEKSSSSSSSEASSMRRSRRLSRRCEKLPRICLIANRWAAREFEAMTSATASAWARSRWPAVKARRVYSPASARRAPRQMRVSRSARWMYREPWTANSTVSSPVNECGPRKTVATQLSSMLPSASVMDWST